MSKNDTMRKFINIDFQRHGHAAGFFKKIRIKILSPVICYTYSKIYFNYYLLYFFSNFSGIKYKLPFALVQATYSLFFVVGLSSSNFPLS